MEKNETDSAIEIEPEMIHMSFADIDEVTVVTLDWDVSFDTYIASNNMKELFKFVDQNHDWIRQIEVRNSASGNCHVRLITEPLTVFEMFQWRAILRDDYRRIVIDLKRLFEHREYNRLWDFKMMADGSENVVRAGDWQTIYSINGWKINRPVQP